MRSIYAIYDDIVLRKFKFHIHVKQDWPPLWSSGQSSWLQIKKMPGTIPGATRFSER
jgi:hypothetical protein